MNMTTTKTARARRRTFKEVAAEAHAKGWSEGREQGRKDVEKDYDTLLATNMELGRKVLALETHLSMLRNSFVSAVKHYFTGRA
jgi:flagellar biosynthesis/type III secretory pathway protein FliH